MRLSACSKDIISYIQTIRSLNLELLPNFARNGTNKRLNESKQQEFFVELEAYKSKHETATKPNVTNEECVHAGKVFSEMEGNELFNMIAERSKIIKRRIDALMELHMSNISSDKPMSGKATKVIKKKKLVVPEDFKDFNIRDFV